MTDQQTEYRTMGPGNTWGPRLVPLFVYGILRPDYAGTPLQSGIHQVDRDARTTGCIHFVMGNMGYPVAFFEEEPDHNCWTGKVAGDVLWVDPSSEWYVTNRRMEEGAGYRVVKINATLADGDTVEAEAFHYTGWAVGQRIPSGDWLAEVRANNWA